MNPKNLDVWNRNARRNADRIANELNKLKHTHWDNFRINYKSFFAHAKEIADLFSTLKPLRKEDRKSLWTEYRQTCDSTAKTQEREREQRQNRSSNDKAVVMSYIREATGWARGARDRNDIQEARNRFQRAHDALQKKSRHMLQQDNQDCWNALKEGRRALHFRTKELQGAAYSRAMEAVGEARSALSLDNPYDSLARLKHSQAATKGLYLNWDQARRVRSDFDAIYRTISRRIGERKKKQKEKHQEYLRRKQERERKHQDWLRKQKDHVQRWEGSIDKLHGVIRRLEGQIGALEDKIGSAWNDDFANRCRGWISEKHRKIADIETTIRDLEGRIRDVRQKIGY